jgi:GNAT superfamily N-acetyltransferase
VECDRLTTGRPGPAGITVRLARADEADDVARLAVMSGGMLDEQMHAAIVSGSASRALLDGLSDRRSLLAPVIKVARSLDQSHMAELSLALVAVAGPAEGPQAVVGTLYTLPPGQFINGCIGRGIDAMTAFALAVKVVKIKALTVEEEWRGQGIASELLSTSVGLYDSLGYQLQYGAFIKGSGLEEFYASRGFKPVTGSIPMGAFLGFDAAMYPEDGQRFFVRSRR